MFDISILSVFIAGIIMFLAPCTLPLVPAFLAFISGVSPKELGSAYPARSIKRAIVVNGVAFVVGFSCIFITFGVLVGLFGMYLAPYKSIVSQLGGLLIIFFGLLTLGVFNIIPLSRDYRLPLPRFLTPGKLSSSFLVGASFAFGWTPCVGPILASVLLLASTKGSIAEGALLLSIFSLGMGIPFIVTAFLYSRAQDVIARADVIVRSMRYIGGVFLILLGVLLATESFGLTVEYGYRIFDFLNYDALLDYL